ncbi:hypothetical protein BRC81_04535 [Halobacteriales archaeon QS_1_68_20]|nr:MAG: hypothetical protein BRC81_04535 [Halobacteriales archaeon QS_1_68_20]
MNRKEAAPASLPVRLEEGGVVVEYLDGREVFYHGVPEAVGDSLRAPPGKHVHVLVTDADGNEGVLVYVDDLKTDAEILESTGVGRLFVEGEGTAQVFPGVTVRRDGHAHVVEADDDTVDGRVFVFAEDQFGESSYELLAED